MGTPAEHVQTNGNKRGGGRATRRRKAPERIESTSKRRERSGSKVEQARAIFNRMEGRPRREVVDAFVNEAALTPSGASTYYQKFLGENKGSGKERQTASQRGRPLDESSKAGMARAMYKKLAGKHSRKEIIQQFVDKLGLTPAGAATYYQSLKKSSESGD